VEHRVRELGLGERIWMAGSRGDIPELMRGLDVFVLPSLAEGISNTILEAMACGLPVIATAVGGNPELVEEGRTGLLVPPADPAAMARAMETCALDADLRRGAGAAGRARAEQRFSLDAMVQAYLGVYDRLCETRG
jgi:glycosyltransferase involved in cell wall biosynthesis